MQQTTYFMQDLKVDLISRPPSWALSHCQCSSCFAGYTLIKKTVTLNSINNACDDGMTHMTLLYYMKIFFKNYIWSWPIDDVDADDDEEEYKEDY